MCLNVVWNISAWLGGVIFAVILYGAFGTFAVLMSKKNFVTYEAWYEMYINGCFVHVGFLRAVTKT